MLELITNAFNAFSNFGLSLLFFNVIPFWNGQKAEFLIAFIMIASIIFLFWLRFVNVKYFFSSIKILTQKVYPKKEYSNTIDSRQAFWSGVSGVVGVGSITGMCVAVYFGGPGVIFWTIICGFITMPMRYSEVYFGHKLRVIKNDTITDCGPFGYFLSAFEKFKYKAFCLKMLALLFVIASLGAVAFQANPILNVIVGSPAVVSLSQNYGYTTKIIFNVILSLLTLYIITGGLHRIAAVGSKLAVYMSALYILAVIAILIQHKSNIGNAVSLIMREAFTPSAVYGGIITVMFLAFRRGIISMEVGFGTTSLIHGRSDRVSSHDEAVLGMIAPFFGSLVFCAINGLMLVASGAFTQGDGNIETIRYAFINLHPSMNYILIVIVALFGFTTIITWFFYAISAMREITKNQIVIKILPYFYTFLVFISALANFRTLLLFIDFCTLLITIPNIIVLFILTKRHIKNGKLFDGNK